MFTGNVKIKRALLSVSDKTDLLKVATILQKFNVEMISTGGTYKTLTENKFKVTPITEVTNNPESFGGRMKTISFQIVVVCFTGAIMLTIKMMLKNLIFQLSI